MGDQNSSGIFNNIIFITAITLLLGFGLGFIAKSILPTKTIQTSSSQKTLVPSPTPQKPAIDESKLPISLALLTNPIVGEWRGSVKGKLTKKDEHTFTLVDEKGSSITITDIMASGDIFKTTFFEKESKKQTSLKDIPLDTVLFGDFFIFRGGSNTPVGSLFVER